jgi:hypothetical protein
MFDIELMSKFYQDIESKNEIDENVIDAYFVFINDFCRLTSYTWNDYLKDLNDEKTASYNFVLTTTDEAFTMWCLESYQAQVMVESETIRKIGFSEWDATRVKKKVGVHTSHEQYGKYVAKYNFCRQIHHNRKSTFEFWQKLFFSRFFGNLNEKNQNTTSTSAYDEELQNASYDTTFV